MSKKTLAVELSKVKRFPEPRDELEQHVTDPDIAAQALWTAHMNGWIKNKVAADLGAGTGVLGIGCLLLGAKKVFFVEKDAKAIKILEENLERIKQEYRGIGKAEILNTDARHIEIQEADITIQNPPFGTRDKHIDKAFLEKAMAISKIVISMHKTETDSFIRKLFEDNNFIIINSEKLRFPLRMAMNHHKKKTEYINVTCWYAKQKQLIL